MEALCFFAVRLRRIVSELATPAFLAPGIAGGVAEEWS